MVSFFEKLYLVQITYQNIHHLLFLDEYGDGALDIWEEFNGEDPDEYRKKSYFGQSLEEQSDYEIQTEHWGKERAWKIIKKLSINN